MSGQYRYLRIHSSCIQFQPVGDFTNLFQSICWLALSSKCRAPKIRRCGHFGPAQHVPPESLMRYTYDNVPWNTTRLWQRCAIVAPWQSHIGAVEEGQRPGGWDTGSLMRPTARFNVAEACGTGVVCRVTTCVCQLYQ